MGKTKLLLIGGPTAVGKTSLSIKCAQKFNGEIISCDSVQVYKGLDIGSAKATKEEQKQAVHHLLDIYEPNESYSVVEFKKKAEELIQDISARGKLPIIVGGTGMFMKSLIYPISFGGADEEKSLLIREKYTKLLQEKGNEWVYNELVKKDSERAKNLHPNDVKRVIRALEIIESTGKKVETQEFEQESPYDYCLIFLDDDREKIYARINKRVDEMFDEGLENEVRGLVEKYNLTSANQSMQAIGYKEFLPYFNGNKCLEEVKEQIKLNSRHYAKRQITWFKAMKGALRLDCKNQDAILEAIKQKLKLN